MKTKLMSVIAATMLSVAPASAGTIVFNISGSAIGGPGGSPTTILSVSGSFGIDEASGTMYHSSNIINVMMIAPYGCYSGCSGTFSGSSINISASNGDGDFASLYIPIPTSDLSTYTGGQATGTASLANFFPSGPCTTPLPGLYRFYSCSYSLNVTVTPAVTAVPGPVVGAGLPGLIFALFCLWRKKRRV